MPKEDALRQERDPNVPEPAPQTSSSSSLSLHEENPDAILQQKSRKKRPKYFRKSLAKTVNGALQRTHIKRRAKKWYAQLTSNLTKEDSGPSQAWRQRRVAAGELLRIAEKEAHGDVAVARRFTKSVARQVNGLHAVLWLCEEEEQEETEKHPRFGFITRENDLSYTAFRTSYCLMMLVMLHADRLLFLETIIPGALKEGIGSAFRPVYFLATSIPDFFDRVDPVVTYEYAIKAIRKSSSSELRWIQATELIYLSFCHVQTSTERGKSATLSTSRLIINSTVELFGEHSWEFSLILRVIVRMGWVAKGKGIFPFIFPKAVLSNIIQKFPSGTEVESFGVPDALVLKLLALWTDELQISTIMSPQQVVWLAEVCMRGMCNKHMDEASVRA